MKTYALQLNVVGSLYTPPIANQDSNTNPLQELKNIHYKLLDLCEKWKALETPKSSAQSRQQKLNKQDLVNNFRENYDIFKEKGGLESPAVTKYAKEYQFIQNLLLKYKQSNLSTLDLESNKQESALVSLSKSLHSSYKRLKQSKTHKKKRLAFLKNKNYSLLRKILLRK